MIVFNLIYVDKIINFNIINLDILMGYFVNICSE